MPSLSLLRATETAASPLSMRRLNERESVMPCLRQDSRDPALLDSAPEKQHVNTFIASIHGFKTSNLPLAVCQRRTSETQ
jgi:hypothetical protein